MEFNEMFNQEQQNVLLRVGDMVLIGGQEMKDEDKTNYLIKFQSTKNNEIYRFFVAGNNKDLQNAISSVGINNACILTMHMTQKNMKPNLRLVDVERVGKKNEG